MATFRRLQSSLAFGYLSLLPATRAKQSLVVSNVRKSSSVASKGRFPMNKGNFFPWLVSLHAFQNGANTASIVISCPYMKSKMRNRG